MDFTRTKVQNLICSLNPYLTSNLPLLSGRVQSPLPLPAAVVGEIAATYLELWPQRSNFAISQKLLGKVF